VEGLSANMTDLIMRHEEDSKESLLADPYFKKRTMANFDFMDKSGNGILTMNEIMWYAENLKKYTGKTDAQIEPFRRVLRECFGTMGVTAEGAKRDEWLGKHAHFCAEELKLKKSGKKTRMRRLFDCFFNFIDLNHDKMLSKDEFAIFAKCVGWPDDMAAKFFARADRNHNGMLEWEEFHSMCDEYWYHNNAAFDDLYGHYF